MPADAPRVSDAIRVGPFNVRIEQREIEEFVKALSPNGVNETRLGRVPLTFPIRWLAFPAVRDAVLAFSRAAPMLLVQESQTFDYVESLEVDRDYTFTVEIHREVSPPHQIVIDSTIDDTAGRRVASLHTVMRALSAHSVDKPI